MSVLSNSTVLDMADFSRPKIPPFPAAGAAPLAGSLPTPREVFHELGDDNVVGLLVHPDSDGDGIADIVAGWGIDKSGDNLTVSRGAGFQPGQLAWGVVTTDGISGGYSPGQECLASYPDSTGDGIDEIIATSGGGGRAGTLYDGADGTVLQSFNTYLGGASGWVYDAAVVGDVNDNGTIDFAIAVGSDDNAVYMVDGGSVGDHHDEIWRHQGFDAFYGVVTVGDIDLDGVPDVVAANGDNSTAVKALSGADGSVLWTTNSGATNWHISSVPDANGDGVDEVVVASWQGQGVRYLSGRTGSVPWTAPAGSLIVQRVVPVDDLDGDGRGDILVAGSSGGASALRGTDGSVIWNRNVGSNVWTVDPVADVTGDGRPEVAFGDFLGFTRLVDGTDGTDLWMHSANGHKVLALVGCEDLDGDGRGEVVIGGQQLASGSEPMLWVVDADSGVAGGPPELTPSGTVTLGSSFNLTLTGATPGDNAWLFGAFTPALAPIFGYGVLGLDPLTFQTLVVQGVPAGGTVVTPINVPGDLAFAGLEVFLQSFVLVPGATGGVSGNRVGFLLEL